MLMRVFTKKPECQNKLANLSKLYKALGVWCIKIQYLLLFFTVSVVHDIYYYSFHLLLLLIINVVVHCCWCIHLVSCLFMFDACPLYITMISPYSVIITCQHYDQLFRCTLIRKLTLYFDSSFAF